MGKGSYGTQRELLKEGMDFRPVMEYSPLAFASTLEAEFSNYLKNMLPAINKLNCYISLLITGVFAWRGVQYREVPSARLVAILVTINFMFVFLHLLLITHKPSVYLHRYNSIVIISRCIKTACWLALQSLFLSREITSASPSIFRDVFISTLAGFLLVAPVADPLPWAPNLAAQLIMLCVIVARNATVCSAAFESDSKWLGLARFVPTPPYLAPALGIPTRARDVVAPNYAPSCEALLSHIQLLCCFAGCVISVATELYHRRTFLLSHASGFGRGAGTAKGWPLSDMRGWGTCAALVVGYCQGFLLLYEILVWS